MKKWIFFLSVLLLGPTTSIYAKNNIQYEMKPGEGVGQVLRKHKLIPIWNKEGSLQKTIDLNPKVFKKYKNYDLPVGTLILLPTNQHRKPSSEKTISSPVSSKVLIKQKNINLPGKYVENFSINFYDGSIPELKNNKQPVVININLFNQPTEEATSTLPIHKKTAKSKIKLKESKSWIPKVKSHGLSASASTHSMKIDATNKSNSTKSELLSDSASSINIDWGQKWSKKLKTSLGFKFSQISILGASKENIVKDNKSTLTRFHLNHSYSYRPTLDFIFNLAQEQRFFVDTSSGSVLVSPQDIIVLEMGVRKAFKQFFTSAIANYALGATAASGDIDAGIGYALKFGYIHELSPESSLDAAFEYKVDNQDTSLYKQSTSNAGVFFSYKKWFGGAK